jgi:hypothetical protein
VLLSSQIEVNEVRKVSKPFPIGLFSMTFDRGRSAMADSVFLGGEKGLKGPKEDAFRTGLGYVFRRELPDKNL